MRFAKLSRTNEAVRRNIGYRWQLTFFASRDQAVQDAEDKGRHRLFWFYLEDDTHKAVRTLKPDEVIDLTGGPAQPAA